MPGPAPKDPGQRRRRNAAVGKTLLPAEGRVGDPVPWPIRSVSEADSWAELWVTPQAAAWEKFGYVRVVARYAMLLDIVDVDPKASLLMEVRQLEDRLGLNPKAMRSLLWEIASDEVAEKRDASVPSKAASKRAELKIVG